MLQEEVHWSAVLVVWVLFGIWALGRYEGWWVYLANKFTNKRKKNNG